jgi:hypothetical protein
MTISLSPSGLRYVDESASGDLTDWGTSVLEYNINRLDSTLLKVSGMGDVTLTSLQDEQALRWNSSLQEYENADQGATTTTTTTSTTTTTTTV